MPENFYLYLGFALVAVGLIASLVIIGGHIHRRTKPSAVAQGFRLKGQVAEQLLPLTPEQHEAVRLYAWAEQVGWEIVAQNVLTSEDFPLTKKGLT